MTAKEGSTKPERDHGHGDKSTTPYRNAAALPDTRSARRVESSRVHARVECRASPPTGEGHQNKHNDVPEDAGGHGHRRLCGVRDVVTVGGSPRSANISPPGFAARKPEVTARSSTHRPIDCRRRTRMQSRGRRHHSRCYAAQKTQQSQSQFGKTASASGAKHQ